MKTPKIKRYRILLVHLVLSSAILGAVVCLINFPFMLIGRFHNGVWRFSNKITILGMNSLRWTQPWWRGEIDVKVPKAALNGTRGCLFVCNHRSHMDVFLLLQQIPGIRILTKNLIFMIPGLGFAAFLFRMIKVNRGDQNSFWKAMNQVERALKEKNTVHVFPEMTRASFGELQLNRFSLVPFQKAIDCQVPIVPVVIWGTDFHWPKGGYRIASQGPLVVESLEPIESKNFEQASKLAEEVKEKIQARVFELSKQYPYEVSQ